MSSFKLSTISIACIFLACIAIPASAASTKLDIKPRLQWEANNGYCGEVSLISAGLFYGQYCSQYTARALASPGIPQSDLDSQLLLVVNAMKAAKAMRLSVVSFDTESQTEDFEFADWIEKEVAQNRPVIIGLLMNYYKFYGETSGGDDTYDHIVPVLGISSSPFGRRNNEAGNVSSRGSESDRLYWSDNGLWAPYTTPPYLFNGVFSSLFKSRSQADSPSAPVYSINNNKMNYGLSVVGVLEDTNKDTVRVKLTTNVNYEKPSMKEGSNTRPVAMPLELTATVEIPDQNVGYSLYLYNKFESVPTSRFNGNAKKASRSWKIPAKSGPKFTVKIKIKSDGVAVFRAVRAAAP